MAAEATAFACVQIFQSKSRLLLMQAPAVPLLFEPYGGFDKLPEGDFVMVLKATQKIVLYVTKQQITASPLSWFIHIWKNCAQAVAVALVATRGDLESEAGKHLQVRGAAPCTSWGCAPRLAPSGRAVRLHAAWICQAASVAFC